MKRILIILAAFLMASCAGTKQADVIPSATPEMLIVRPTREIQTAVVPEVVLTVTAMSNFRELIFLDGISRGVYGRTVITNDGTPNRLEYIGYFVPAGRYIARNERDYPDGLLVYSSRTIWQDGVEYPADTKSYKFMKIGETQEITVPEGYYIKVIPPTSFSLTAK